jgi:hypothetical protein
MSRHQNSFLRISGSKAGIEIFVMYQWLSTAAQRNQLRNSEVAMGAGVVSCDGAGRDVEALSYHGEPRLIDTVRHHTVIYRRCP